MATILVTGGTGYIGSHTCVELLNAGYDVIIMDNLYNSSEEVLKRIEKITGKKAKFYKVDLLDKEGIRTIFHQVLVYMVHLNQFQSRKILKFIQLTHMEQQKS